MESVVSAAIPPGAFKHEPLPHTAKYIRLLEVLDSNDIEGTKIRCKLTTWRIGEVPPYHAISYAWGDPEPRRTILINDQPFIVGENCEFVLKQCSWYKTGRYYWVDAVCVDQKNLEEKSAQVSIMGKIYQQASHVLASVGDHKDDSHFLFQRVQQRFTAWSSSYGRRAMAVYMAREVATIRRLLWAAISFTQRPYFTRMWVLPEQQHAKQVTFLCGPDVAPKEVVRNITSLALTFCTRFLVDGPRESPLLAVQMWKSADTRPIPRAHDLIRDRDDALVVRENLQVNRGVLSDDPAKRRIPSMLETASGLRCTDNKDKIYAIISLLGWGPVRPPAPNYTKTDYEVALDFVLAMSRLHRIGAITCESLTKVSKFAWRNLALNIESDGVRDAVEARRGPPTIPLSMPEVSSTDMEINGLGCVIAPGSLSERSGFTTWFASRVNDWKIHLPPWAKPGDLAVFSQNFRACSSPILVRMVPFDAPATAIVDEGGLILGHGYAESSVQFGRFDAVQQHRFLIRWDSEDELIANMVSERMQTSKMFSPEWINALNIGVCRKQMSVSSYVAVDWDNRTALVSSI